MDEIEPLTIERIDDVPVWLAQLERMGTGSRAWLSHILSEGDYWHSHVEPWAGQHLTCLQACLGQEVRSLDYLSTDEPWQAFERELIQHLIRVYDLRPSRVRLDSTTVSGSIQPSPDGLFQLGLSWDHRPDLPQVKVKLSVLDRLVLPVGLTLVSGQRADDGLYVPAIQRVQQTLGQGGLLYVGDCKLAGLSTRAYVHQSGDFYLCPLSDVQVSEALLQQLVAPVQAGTQPMTTIERQSEDGQPEAIAVGYEYTQQLSLTQQEHTVQWHERVLVVRSLTLAHRQQAALHERLAKAQAELAQPNQRERKRGKKILRQASEMREVAEAIVHRYRVDGLLDVQYHEHIVSEQLVRRYRERAGGMRLQRTVSLSVQVNVEAVEEAMACLGWHVYVTNQSADQLSLEQAVLAYRGEYLIEPGFARLKGRPLSVRRLHFTDEQRVKGLLRLLSLELCVLCLLEYQVHSRLTHQQQALTGLYAGNPKRATQPLTGEALLKAFKGLHLTALTQQTHTVYYVSPLSALQQRIIALLGFPADLYSILALHSDKLTVQMSEP